MIAAEPALGWLLKRFMVLVNNLAAGAPRRLMTSACSGRQRAQPRLIDIEGAKIGLRSAYILLVPSGVRPLRPTADQLHDVARRDRSTADLDSELAECILHGANYGRRGRQDSRFSDALYTQRIER